VIRLPGTTQPRFEIHGEVAGVQKLWASLAGQVTYVGAEPWRLLDILTGIPTIYNETSEAFIPHMINLQLINGVSFRKGCYTGQEIVARTQYLGQIKRRMYRAHVESASPPRPGDELFSPQGADNESVGKIVDVCQHPEGGYELLAVVALAFAENGKVVLGENNRFPLAFRPLPYVFETGVI
jgi:hypothetical protein